MKYLCIKHRYKSNLLKTKIMKKLMILMMFCLWANYLSSQTIVKLALPNNCNFISTQVENLNNNGDSQLEIFPNPNLGIFTLVVSFNNIIEKANINVYDIKGKSVYDEIVFSNTNKLIKQLEISGLLPGIYICQVKNSYQVLSIRLVINK